MKNRGMVRRPLALTAATTIALGGLFFGAPAFAEDTTGPATEPTATPSAAPTTEAPAPAETSAPAEQDAPPAEVVEAADAAAEEGVDIVAFGTNAKGQDVVVVSSEVSESETDEAVEAFSAQANLESPKVVTLPSEPVAFAEGDLVGGQGYLAVTQGGQGYSCSIGFSGFSPDGDEVLLSAGHCAFDDAGAKMAGALLTVPVNEDAGGGSGSILTDPPKVLGTFGFAQFGSTGNAPGAEGDPNATDISIIELSPAGGFNPLPAVTDWTTEGESLYSLADHTIPITAVGEPVPGAVSKSGRTTGYTTGAFAATDLVGWSRIEDRWVRGFSSNVPAAPGDSGGAVFQGNTAVGLISGGITAEDNGGVQWTWATSLTHALQLAGGYEVEIALDAPVVTSPASGSTVVSGTTITGTAPANATEVKVSLGNSGFSVPVTNGTFSFAAPAAPGDYAYTLTSVSGYSRSASTSYDITVELAPTPAPVITSPADGSTVTSNLVDVTGTALPGAEVVVTIDGEEHTVTASEAGAWAISGLELGYGEHVVTAVQTANDDESDPATSTFVVAPAAPAITSIANGAEFAHDKAPSTLSGTGIDGATVTVTLNGAEPASAKVSALAAKSGTFTATVVNGTWTVDFGAALTPGSYSVSATQTVDEATSPAAAVSFAVLAAPGGSGGSGGSGDGNLATTGGDLVGPLSAAAGALVLLAGGATLMTMRRRKLVQD